VGLWRDTRLLLAGGLEEARLEKNSSTCPILGIKPPSHRLDDPGRAAWLTANALLLSHVCGTSARGGRRYRIRVRLSGNSAMTSHGSAPVLAIVVEVRCSA
jgi:hypothetical protein